ncbi:hypothetical protein H4Q26_003528 [Puccinia striiformis f. sp. tritici PST-130]|nr:hypothetical protein H4Q26_003528 [Puccinia striiformis f. sp. tritici PST-130]
MAPLETLRCLSCTLPAYEQRLSASQSFRNALNRSRLGGPVAIGVRSNFGWSVTEGSTILLKLGCEARGLDSVGQPTDRFKPSLGGSGAYWAPMGRSDVDRARAIFFDDFSMMARTRLALL